MWFNSTCFILLYGGDVFVFHMLASQIAISHKENTHMGRLYLFVLGGITFILFNVRLCGIIFAYSHLLAYCLLCGDMSVNPLLLITHCQDIAYCVVICQLILCFSLHIVKMKIGS